MSLRTASANNHSSDDEKVQPNYGTGVAEPYEDPMEENEVFKKTKEGVDFRTVGWPRASVIFLKGNIDLQFPNTLRILTYIQSFLLRECSVFHLRCIVWERSVVLLVSLVGELSTPTQPSFRETSEIPILDATPSQTWQQSLEETC